MTRLLDNVGPRRPDGRDTGRSWRVRFTRRRRPCAANVSLAAAGATVVAVWSASGAVAPPTSSARSARTAVPHFGAPVRVNATAGDARVNAEQPPRVALREQAGRPPAIAVVWTTKGRRRHSHPQRVVGRRRKDVQDHTCRGHRRTRQSRVGSAGSRSTGTVRDGLAGSSTARHTQDAAVAGEHRHHDATTPRRAGEDRRRGHGATVAALCRPAGRRPRPGRRDRRCVLLLQDRDRDGCRWRRCISPGGTSTRATCATSRSAASRDGGRTFAAPIRVSEDKWQIEGCPDDGPSMAIDPRGRIHVVWPSVVTERGGPVKALFHAVSIDGRIFSPRTRIPTEGQAHHPQLAINRAGQLRVVWDESGAGSRRLASAAGVVEPKGTIRFSRTAADAEPGTYPITVPVPGGWLTAWTTGAPDASVVRLARAGAGS